MQTIQIDRRTDRQSNEHRRRGPTSSKGIHYVETNNSNVYLYYPTCKCMKYAPSASGSKRAPTATAAESHLAYG